MKDLSFLINYKYAHRGLHNASEKIIENSKSAFLAALKNGYAIELDIRATKDLKWVCHHDNNLKRLMNENIKINTVTFDKIKSIKYTESDDNLLLLTDLLILTNNKVPLLIEVKSGKHQALINLVNILDQYEGKFAVFSFSPKIVNWFKNNRPMYIRGQISSFFNERKAPKFIKYFYKSMWFNRFNKPDFISYNINNLPNKYVKHAQNQGLVTLGYTAFNKDQYNFALSYLDNIVFEGFKP